MAQPTENFDFVENGVPYTKLCMGVTVYWRGSAFDKVDSIISFYRQALAEIGKDLRFFETGSMAGAKKLRKDTLEMVPFWFQNRKRRPDIYWMNLESGQEPNEPSDRALCVIADEEDDEPVGLAKLSLPVSYGTESPDRFLKLVKELTANADFESGYAGYSLNWDKNGEYAVEASQKIAQMALRFWGIDFFSLFTTLIAMRNTKPSGIKRVNWLTLLGRSLTERVGGIQTLRSKLVPSCEVYPVSNGVLIRAGPKPTTGDRNSAAALAPYRSVGKLLAPFRFKDHKPFFGAPDDPTADGSSRWLARLDG